MSDVVPVSQEVFDRLLLEARANPNIECCGLLAGRGGVISSVLPAQNALQSSTSYEIAPAEIFTLFRRMRSEGLEHLGIYHSHPKGVNFPSATDLERAFYPEAAYLIVSPNAGTARPIRAFRIIAGCARELAMEIISA